MKILAVSDRVMDQLYSSTVRSRHPDIDLVIGCGDLPYYYLEFLISALDVPLYFVRGNHDQGPQYTADGRTLHDVQGGVDLHGRTANCKGILLAGLEGSIRYRPYATLMYTEAEMRRHVIGMMPRLYWNRVRHGRYLDILVTHSPPFQIHDRPDIAHTGFKIFRNFISWFKPNYLLHGHIHVYRQEIPRVTVFEQTTIINVYPSRIVKV